MEAGGNRTYDRKIKGLKCFDQLSYTMPSHKCKYVTTLTTGGYKSPTGFCGHRPNSSPPRLQGPFPSSRASVDTSAVGEGSRKKRERTHITQSISR